MLKWLAGIANDLKTLEADAAPAGWQCLWNRYAAVVITISNIVAVHASIQSNYTTHTSYQKLTTFTTTHAATHIIIASRFYSLRCCTFTLSPFACLCRIKKEETNQHIDNMVRVAPSLCRVATIIVANKQLVRNPEYANA